MLTTLIAKTTNVVYNNESKGMNSGFQPSNISICRLNDREAKMTTKVVSSDLRVRRTRLMIERAFLELVQQEDFQSITVQQITDRAMVNRATFYDHFADKYALFEYSIRNQFQQLIQSKLPPDFTYCASNLQFLIETLCQFVAQVNDHCRTRIPRDCLHLMKRL